MQLVINIFLASSVILMVAVSFAIIYQTTRFFHFAHAVVFTFGAYFTFLFLKQFGFPLCLSIALGTVCSLIAGCLIELLLYRPLRNKKASSLVLLLASLGIYTALQNLISMIFGDDTKSIRTGIIREGLDVFGARITPMQITIICTSIVLTILVILVLKLTKFGKAMRAVANDPELASVSGINSNNIILYSFALGSALAGIAGILVALDADMVPTMGMNALLLGVVAVILGGKKSILGISCAALLLGTVRNLGVWEMSSQWQDVIVFVMLLAFLLFKPEGFFGDKVKRAEV